MEGSPVALLLFAATVGISLYGLYKNPAIIYKLALKPYEVIHHKSWSQVITSGFVHSNMPHLLFNMLTFFFFAFSLEQAIGSLNFIIIYFISLVLSDVTTILKQKENPHYLSLGASGAISGVVFSYILFFPQMEMMIFPLPIPIPAPIFAILYLAYCSFAGKRAADNINHEAHFWGALSGVIITILIQPSAASNFFQYLINIF